jgi:hypothetical protein
MLKLGRVPILCAKPAVQPQLKHKLVSILLQPSRNSEIVVQFAAAGGGATSNAYRVIIPINLITGHMSTMKTA